MSRPAPPAPEASGDTLIFHWRGRPWRVWRLGITLLVSLLGHAAMFYLLQVAYTPTASLQPPAAQVVLLAPTDPAQKAALNQWLQTADPALMTEPPIVNTAAVPDKVGLRYVPSYAGVPPAFKPLEPAARGPEIAGPARSRPPGPVSSGPDEFPALAANHPPNAAASPPTRLIFRGAVRELAPAPLPPWKFAASQGTRPLEPTVYLVGVRPEGGAPWLFRQPAAGETATGDATLEEAAHDYLARLVFRRPAPSGADGEVVWGWATFYWGREIYR